MTRDVVAAKADIYAAMCANEHKSQLTADKRWAARNCVFVMLLARTSIRDAVTVGVP